MSKSVSSLYTSTLVDVRKNIVLSIDKGCSKSTGKPVVFFRADDIGIPSSQFTEMIDSFKKHKLPLALATVPAWLNENRLTSLRQTTGPKSSQWFWHQHGFVHRNYEPMSTIGKRNKKQEFGPSRRDKDISTSLTKGRLRLEDLLGDSFQPVFTPPWNRCSKSTIDCLVQNQFQAISRSRGALPQTPAGFPDYQVNVDLHTRKESVAETAFTSLLAELEVSLASGFCGIMLHHQRMNSRAMQFLHLLLEALGGNRQLTTLHFGDLLHLKD